MPSVRAVPSGPRRPGTAVTPSLYRREALAARHDRRYGECARIGLPRHRAIAVFAALACLGIGAFLFAGTYAARETVRGIVTTTAANVVVRPQRGGVVSMLQVGEGEHVAAGQPLASLSNERVAAGARVDDALEASLLAEDRSLRAELEITRKVFAADRQSLADDAAAARAEAVLLQRELAGSARRHELARAATDALSRVVAKGHVARVELERQESHAVTVAAERDALARQLLRTEQRARQAARDAAILPDRLALRQAALERDRERVQQQLATLRAARDETVVAPLAGRISGIGIRPGEHVAPGAALFTLLPDDARFEVRLEVPDSVIGHVRPGMPVRLRIDAFPHQKYGVLAGEVAAVSEAPVVSNAHNTGVWRARVALPDDPPALRLQPGMTATAVLLRDRRRIVNWLLQPLAARLGR